MMSSSQYLRCRFDAFEYTRDARFEKSAWAYFRDPETGWRIEREGAPWLDLGRGYRLLDTSCCGICATDLERHFLPFRLPQVTGHEVVAHDEQGHRYAVEINASRAARGLETDNVWARAGLDSHDPNRLVLGIRDLPGGFGPKILVPEHAMVEIPTEISDETAVLTEPFAAVLRAVATLRIRAEDRIAVLGPRRLGLLTVAALAAVRRTSGQAFEIEAWSRHAALGELALELGADRVRMVSPEGDRLLDGGRADIVIDTTGNPTALTTALELADREVHIKSTHGRAAAGLTQATALVVDEIGMERFAAESSPRDHPGLIDPLSAGAAPKVAWLSRHAVPAWLRDHYEIHQGHDPAVMGALYAQGAGAQRLPRADAAVVDDLAMADRVIRPDSERSQALVRPRGVILLHEESDDPAPLARAVVERGLRLSTSRCGDFRPALELLAGDSRLRELGARFVTHRFSADALPQAFVKARQPDCIKALIVQE